MKALLNALDDTINTINEPKQSEHGAPDFIILGKKNKDLKLGYGEAKIPGENLDKIEKSEQMNRYKGYANLFLTDCLDWRFFQNGEKVFEIRIGELSHDKKELNRVYPEKYNLLANEIASFLSQPPESIRSGKHLAEIMGAKARRIRDNVQRYLSHNEDERNQELEKIYNMMKELLVHDLSAEKFADMYAQTLVYGLFVARYSDETPEGFTRIEARDLVPASNPFLREFFDHIVGPRFDKRLRYIVDELCEIFGVSDVNGLVHKHLRILEAVDEKDPIIHFYEDFLKEYDPDERKKMGAYYTPLPVVRFIVNKIDEILKKNFGIINGLADTEKKQYLVESQGQRLKQEMHRVQILDPAVGTATFLNEVIMKIYNDNFKGQEGRWSSYVKRNLLPRLFGFELMMAPYTIAHLKLGMTLQETGVKNFKERLGVYLTNTLEEGQSKNLTLFDQLPGLAGIVSKESIQAGKIKHERPIMVVLGNPPYSVSSNNKSKYIQDLIKDYKKSLNERKTNLDDDYIKFIRFAEEMIIQNGEGVVGMITNNSFIDGITHRQMRKHLLETFDDIYILDLHGNSKKKEVCPDGSKDDNIFNIMQGVSINIFIKRPGSRKRLANVYHAEAFGKRIDKFTALNNDAYKFKPVKYAVPNYFFVPKNTSAMSEYLRGVSVNDLFINKSSGFRSGAADSQICFDRENIIKVVQDLIDLSEADFRIKYNLKDGRNHNYRGMREDIGNNVEMSKVIQTAWHSPFDVRWTYYSYKSSGFAARPRNQTMNNFVGHNNIGLLYMRGHIEPKGAAAGITNLVSSERTFSRPGMSSADSVAPLYLYHDDGSKMPNFDPHILKELTKNLGKSYNPEDVLDYIYATLHSPKYRDRYKEFLKIDFPRVPIPKNDIEFKRFAKFGKDLRELHLMVSTKLNSFITTFPVEGNGEVEKIEYKNGKVYINTEQYFGNVSEVAWNFYIGGYQPAQKWLKDRRGRTLNSDDLEHYQKIIKILVETDRVMGEIG